MRSLSSVVHCAGGYRSSVAASVLRKAGWTDVSDLLGGFNGWALANRRPGPIRASGSFSRLGARPAELRHRFERCPTEGHRPLSSGRDLDD